jgi:hypothetical protein
MEETLIRVAIITGSAGLVGALIGGGISAFVTSQNQNRIDQADRRRQAALVLGRQRAFIDDFSPDQWAFNAGPESSAVYDAQRNVWRDLRPQIMTLRVLYPDHVDDVEEIYTTTDSLMVEIARLVKAALRAEDGLLGLRDKAIQSQARARELTNSMMDHVGRA